MLKRILLAVAAAAVVVVVVLFTGSQEQIEPVRPDIPFAPLFDSELSDPDHPGKRFRIDMARVEHEFPLSRADLAGLNPEHVLSLNQEELDQLYGRLTAGPIPDGPYLGDLFFPRDEDGLKPRLEQILGGLKGRLAGKKIELVEKIGRALWKGKMFYRDERLLRNFIEDFKPLERLIDDPDALLTATVPREGWFRSARSANSSRSSATSTRSRSIGRANRPSSTTSRTVNRAETAGRCGTYARRWARCRAPVRWAGCPFTRTRPDVGRSDPIMHLSRVDLPAALGPSNTVTAPRRASVLTSSSAVRRP